MWHPGRDHSKADVSLRDGDEERGCVLVCDECGSPAKLSIDALGAVGSYCEYCAEIVLGFRGLPQVITALARPRRNEVRCPFCHTKADEVLATGLAGCPLCFEAFPEVWKTLGIVG